MLPCVSTTISPSLQSSKPGLGEGSLKMVGQQYSAEQRTFMAIEYFKNVGTRGFMDMIIADFVAQYPNAMPPSRITIW